MSATHQAREAAPAMEAAPSTYAQEQTTDSNDRLQRLISVTHIGSGPMSISRDLMVADALEEILSGHYASEIANLRDEIVCCGRDSEQVKKAKLVLPAYLLSGRVEGKVAQAMNEGRFHHAGLLQLDFDKLEDPAATRDMIIQDPHVLASWISPSGDGVKGLQVMDLAATEAEHFAAFQSAEAYWQARGLTLDKACKNSNRLCFASHDPDLRWKEDAIPLRVDPPPPPPPKAAKPQVEGSPKSPKIVLSETHSPREITAEDARAMLAAIPPRPEYSQWLRIASAVWDAVGESAGTALLNAWSPEERPGEYAGKFSDRLTQVRAGTLVMLAKDHGWTSPSQKSTHTDKGNIPEAEQEARKASLRTLAYALRFDPNSPPPPDETCMSIGDIPIASRGNLTVIQGKSKVGKSAVVAAVMGAAQRGNQYSAADSLCMSWEGEGTGAIIHLDTEQSLADWHGLVSRSVTRSGLPEVSPRLVSLPLVMFARSERLEILRQTLEHEMGERGSIDAVIIDGIADLCLSPNDEEEALEVVSQVMALSQKFSTPVFCVLHENPGSEIGKTRGHLGSELNRKAFANLRIDKDSETTISTLYGLDMRKREIPKEQGFCFAWNDEAGMHTFQGRAAGLKAAQREEGQVRAAREYWGPIFEFFAANRENPNFPSVTAKLAVEADRETSGKEESVSIDTMKKRLQKAEALGVLRKTGVGEWVLVPAGKSGKERES